MDILTATDKPMKMLGIYPTAAEPQAVEEEGRDVLAGVLRYLNS